MILDESYNRKAFQSLIANLLPDMAYDTREIEVQSENFTSASMLGRSETLDLYVLEVLVADGIVNRVSITRSAFGLLKQYGIYNAVIAFTSEKSDQWRLSLMTATAKLDQGKSVVSFSNPKRNSFVLGPSAKTKTPAKLLISSGEVQNLQELQERFSIEVVNKEFFSDIARLYRKLVGDHSDDNLPIEVKKGMLRVPELIDAELAKQQFAVRLIGRLVFCWFLRQKKSGREVPLLPDDFFNVMKSTSSFYHDKLEPLFFETLNKSAADRLPEFSSEPYSLVPYLNGGLFHPKSGHGGDYYSLDTKKAKDLVVPNSWFVEFFELLNRFNFTVDENSSFDTDLSVDPEMLGRIFENLLAEINPDTGEAARKSTGSFYTPRSVVDYMVDRTILAFLVRKTDIPDYKLKALISYDQMDDDEYPLSEDEKRIVTLSLLKFRVLDPACGSGAFPIGILQKVVWIQQQVDPNAEMWLEMQFSGMSIELQRHLKNQVKNENFDYLRKLGVIRETLFGVDIQPIATEMSRLRCFLTLIVEEDVKDNLENRGIQPLPNLEFKFITANSLMDLSEVNEETSNYPSMFDDNKLILQLKDVRDQYFTSTGKYRSKLVESFTKVQNEMKSNLDTIQFSVTSKAFQKLAEWDPFGVDGVDWFDAEWMFGTNKFDAVICNPPYVGEKGHKEMFREIRSSGLRDYYQGKMDLFYFFFHLAIDHVDTGGVITFITTNYFPTALGARNLRNDIKNRTTVLEIINFNELRIFESALGQHNMVTILEKGNRDVDAIFNMVTQTGLIKHQDLDRILHKSLDQQGVYTYSQKNIFDGPEAYIRFPNNELDSILEKMAIVEQRLIDICNVNQGVITGADRFSKRHSEMYPEIKAGIGAGIFRVQASDWLDVARSTNAKPFFKNSAIRRWRSESDPSSYLLYLSQERKPTKSELKYLQTFKEVLQGRSGVLAGEYEWWSIHRSRRTEIFEGPKIVCPQRSGLNTFAYNEQSWYGSADVYYITAKNDNFDLKPILSLLNSKLYYCWFYNRGKRKGEALELFQIPLSELPIPKLPVSVRKELSALASLAMEQAAVGRFDLLSEIEAKIDDMVFNCFNLSNDQKLAVLDFWNLKKLVVQNLEIDNGTD